MDQGFDGPENVNYFTPDDADDIKEEVEKSGVEGFLRYLREKEESWKAIPLDIAVIGNSGVGKSSFINAIRNLSADEEGAAEVGVNETTSKIEAYTHPQNPLLKFWDLPGVGTPNFPKDTYLEQIEVRRYDFFLLLSATRFTENDAWLGGKIKSLGKRYFYIRTKIANDVSNDQKAHRGTRDKEKVIRSIRERIQSQLGDNDTLYFLIDNYELELYDFVKLQESLVEKFPKLKKSALVLSMSASSEQVVRLKVAELRSKIWKWSLISAAVAVVPLPGFSIQFDLDTVLAQAEFYKSQLGLDEKSLERFAKMDKSIDLRELQGYVDKSGFVLTIERLQFLTQSLPEVTSLAVKEFWKLHLMRSIISAPLSFSGTYRMLNVVLDKMEEASVTIVRMALKQLEEEKNEEEC